MDHRKRQLIKAVFFILINDIYEDDSQRARIRDKKREQKQATEEKPINRHMLNTSTRFSPERVQNKRMRKCRITIKIVVGIFDRLKRTAFFKTCFVLFSYIPMRGNA